MSGMMNQFYYGKAGQADFTPEQLPANRVQLFFSMLRIRFGGLVGMNLLYLLFWIPTLAWTFINIQVISIGNPILNELGEIVESIPLTAQETSGYLMTYLLGMIPCLLILSIGTVGITYVLRNWARDQHAFTMSDFRDSIKANWKQALPIGLINGISLPIGYVCYTYYGSMTASSMFWQVPRTLVVCLLALWWACNMLIFPMMVTYKMNLRTLIRNGVIMAMARLPFTVIFAVLPWLIPGLIAFFIPYGSAVMLIYFVVIGFSLTMFMQVSYANSTFDRYLNPRIEGAEVNMGLRDPKYNDDDDDDEQENDPNLIH